MAMLCSNGGFSVTLRLPGVAVSGADAEQLGLSTPFFQEVQAGPAVWRKLGSTAALLIEASAIEKLVGSGGFASAKDLFEDAVGIVVDGVLYAIKDAEPLVVAGTPCAYRVTVEAPAWS